MSIYLVKTPSSDKLVDANSKSQAIKHVIRNTVTAESLSASDTVAKMQAGLTVEKAGEVEEVETPKPSKPNPPVSKGD